MTRRRYSVLLSALATLGALAFGAPALADSGIQVMQPRAFATPSGAPTALVLLTLHNIGATADTLLGASTPLAAKVEMHSMDMTGGTMRMRPLKNMPVPVGSLVEFRSGGNHLMLVGLKRPLVAGQVVPLTLRFQKAGAVRVDVPVVPLTTP
jgi:periplasmic copper chaperone A